MDVHAVELAVLSGMVADRHLLTLALNEGFTPELLSHPVTQRLSRVILEASLTRGVALDAVTLAAELQDRGLLSPEMEKAVTALSMTRPPTAAQLVAYLELLKGWEGRRRLEAVGQRIQEFLAGHPRAGTYELLQFTGEVVADLFELQKRRLL